MRLLGTFLTVLVLLFQAPPANAARFGLDESVHFLQAISLKGAKGEELFLGYLTRTQNFFAGLYVEDAGYVLGVKGDSKRYYSMPRGDELVRFQKAGLLPEPLPPYQLNWIDYLIGYSLWLVIAVMVAWLAIGVLRKRSKATVTN